MREAKSQLSRLGRLAWEGEEVVIARAGEPYLRLEPYREPRGERELGGYEGQIWVSPDFDEPIPELEEAIEDRKILPSEE
ncbi:MAG: type II toxin-antitoxin system prevent-host-death family antitoxin [Acidobacteriota bacterium]|nr:type II toxin-antitoxin system prevent-host-death family antitoxin [Acidobacteriota bacterium]